MLSAMTCTAHGYMTTITYDRCMTCQYNLENDVRIALKSLAQEIINKIMVSSTATGLHLPIIFKLANLEEHSLATITILMMTRTMT